MLGLETSLFERYSRQATMLNIQYRQNPEINKFPSEQFYGGKLRTKPSPKWVTDIPLSCWTNRNVPVIFCHIAGTEDYLPFNTIDGNERSCSNQQEVEQVLNIFIHLLHEESIKAENINIMTPYNSQCNAIITALKKANQLNFNVNTIVTSQGGEWDYVIFSLVRSLPDYRIEPNPTLGWCTHNIGFITDEHQTNVALTRARKGLIVVGNKDLIKRCELWGKFISHYSERGCVVKSENFPPLPTSKLNKKRKKKHNRF